MIFLLEVHIKSGSFSNDKGEGNENVKKAISLISKTTALHVHHAFLYISLPSLHSTTTTWNGQILRSFEKGNGQDINSSISVWTRGRSPLFSSNIYSPLFSIWATWYNREKVKWAKSIFQGCFHGRRRCRIVRSVLSPARLATSRPHEFHSRKAVKQAKEGF